MGCGSEGEYTHKQEEPTLVCSSQARPAQQCGAACLPRWYRCPGLPYWPRGIFYSKPPPSTPHWCDQPTDIHPNCTQFLIVTFTWSGGCWAGPCILWGYSHRHYQCLCTKWVTYAPEWDREPISGHRNQTLKLLHLKNNQTSMSSQWGWKSLNSCWLATHRCETMASISSVFL